MADALERLAALHAALPDMVERAVEKTMQRGAEIARQTHKFRNWTGRLEASIQGGILEHSPTHVQGVLSAGADDAQSRPGWQTPSRTYGPIIELGTPRRDPKPFIHPAFTQAVRAEGVLQDALEDGLRQVLR